MKNYRVGLSGWNLAVILSLLLHTVFFVSPSNLLNKIFTKKPHPLEKKNKEIEIIPEKIDKIIKKPLKEFNNPAPLPYTENILSDLIKKTNLSSLEKPRIIEKSTKEILFSKIPKNIDKTLRKNPAYMNYYRLIREKIRASAYRGYDSKEEGEVLVNFVILNNGVLSNVELSSEAENGLGKIAVESIKKSAPFPIFPVKLNEYSKLYFSIPIYFKNN
ncbi:MAG: TonB family protein [Candidatus Omnitrophota bacterium]